MALIQRQSQTQRQIARADPQLLQTNRLLQMSTLELRECFTRELDENPALELLDHAPCAGCDVTFPRCFTCPLGPSAGGELRGAGGALLERAKGEGEEWNPISLAEAPATLQDHLREQLAAFQDAEQRRIGEYLIANIDDNGYLQCTVEEAAAALDASPAEVRRALEVVQGLEPSGVGARNLQECLLIQARGYGEEHAPSPHVEAILSEHWRDLGCARLDAIARRLKTPVREVEQCLHWIRTHLSPYPGSQYRPTWRKRDPNSAQAVRPDVAARLAADGKVEVEVQGGAELPSAHLNPHYVRLCDDIRAQPHLFSVAERKHVDEYLLRAQRFLKGLQDRTSILRQVAETVAAEQELFLRSEREEDMRPLTQAQVASFLHVHESTVSRAVADKFWQLPSGRMIPFSLFFDRSLSHRRLVANVVATEDPAAPYSDQQIADILRRQGVTIARRTVMKYREELNILSSRQRSRPRT